MRLSGASSVIAANAPDAPRASGATPSPPAPVAMCPLMAGASPSPPPVAGGGPPRSISISYSPALTAKRWTLVPSSRRTRSRASAQVDSIMFLSSLMCLLCGDRRKDGLPTGGAELSEPVVAPLDQLVGRQAQQLAQAVYERPLEVGGGGGVVGVGAVRGLRHHGVHDLQPQQLGRGDPQRRGGARGG